MLDRAYLRYSFDPWNRCSSENSRRPFRGQVENLQGLVLHVFSDRHLFCPLKQDEIFALSQYREHTHRCIKVWLLVDMADSFFFSDDGIERRESKCCASSIPTSSYCSTSKSVFAWVLLLSFAFRF
jgi:hypothetical protein